MAEETHPDEGSEIRRRALMRLGIAGVITAAALAGLWWLDQTGKQPPSKPAPPPTPIISAPAPSISPPPIAEDLPPEEADAATETAQAETTPPPPPPMAGNLPRPQTAAPRISGDSGSAPRQTAPTAPSSQRAAAPASKPAAPPPASGYVVQLGVFSNPDNAKELIERLRKVGIRAQSETRVQVGPFLNRLEAEKAQAEMRKLGLNAVINPPNGATR